MKTGDYKVAGLAGAVVAVLAAVAVSLGFIWDTNKVDLDYTYLIADEPAERVTGLGGRLSLPSTHVMLFVFDEPDRHGIWMKDMQFAIDIAWLDANAKVVHLKSNVSPATFPDVFQPPTDALYVIEANAGQLSARGLTIGSVVDPLPL